ncbi:hypothetical protein [Aquirhabdus sp.]|uniref:hypothetical protein n=1 Tax=Aquirhabdus sp. TaxID=2824160 RepID=UPI00396CDC56
MKTYLISAELLPHRDDSVIAEAIEQLSTQTFKYQSAKWIIKHDGDAGSIHAELVPALKNGEKLMVLGLSGEGAWTGVAPSSDHWLHVHL